MTTQSITMERKHLAISWGKRVVSEAGWSGKLRGAYLAPRTGRITHVLVRRGLLRRAEPRLLDDSRQEEDGLLVLSQQQRQSAAAPGRGSIPLSPRTMVRCSDGASLRLQGLILNRESRTIESILVGDQGNARAISHHHVQKLTSGSPSVTLAQADLEALPVYRPDDEAQRNALAALANADPTGGGVLAAVRIYVVDGTAQLSGNVRFPVQRRNAERAVRKARGVLEVQNAIVTDWDLSIASAEALAREGITRQGLVLVKSALGRVTLNGHLPSQQYVDYAVAVARGVPGVQSVEQSIQVRPVPAPEPATVAETAEH